MTCFLHFRPIIHLFIYNFAEKLRLFGFFLLSLQPLYTLKTKRNNINKTKTNKKMKKMMMEAYEAPMVELLDIAVEQGFATSNGDLEEDNYGDVE